MGINRTLHTGASSRSTTCAPLGRWDITRADEVSIQNSRRVVLEIVTPTLVKARPNYGRFLRIGNIGAIYYFILGLN